MIYRWHLAGQCFQTVGRCHLDTSMFPVLHLRRLPTATSSPTSLFNTTGCCSPSGMISPRCFSRGHGFTRIKWLLPSFVWWYYNSCPRGGLFKFWFWCCSTVISLLKRWTQLPSLRSFWPSCQFESLHVYETVWIQSLVSLHHLVLSCLSSIHHVYPLKVAEGWSKPLTLISRVDLRAQINPRNPDRHRKTPSGC